MKMNKKIVIAIVAALVVIAGIVTTVVIVNQNNKKTDTTAQTQVQKLHLDSNNQLSYSGRDGVTALALLQEYATMETTGSGEMAYVTAIDRVFANPSNQYWELLINGVSSQVGAGTYVTKSTDTITWKLSSF